MQYLYEILIRGRPDGSFSAHQKMATIYEDGFFKEGLPSPLDPALVESVLGEAFTNLANQLEAANAALAEKNRQIEALQQHLAQRES